MSPRATYCRQPPNGTTIEGGDLSNTFCVDQFGRTLGCGVAFELSPPASPRSGVWAEAVLHSFELGGRRAVYIFGE
jgi:hypothetical protein